MKNYKIEKRPTIWQVILSSGDDGFDYNETHLHFMANSQEDAWEMLKEYFEDVVNPKDEYKKKAIYWESMNKKWAIPTWRKRILSGKEYDSFVNWDTCYGHAYKVEIKMLDLIIFSRLKNLN